MGRAARYTGGSVELCDFISGPLAARRTDFVTATVSALRVLHSNTSRPISAPTHSKTQRLVCRQDVWVASLPGKGRPPLDDFAVEYGDT